MYSFYGSSKPSVGWGSPAGKAPSRYLLDLWARRSQTDEGEYYRGILSPMFFDAMATGSSSRSEHPVLGFVPYLNGGLFRRSALEDRINDAGEVSLPDEVFDPEGDGSLLNLLSRYRFTTRESTPDDQSVDPDPELLGRVFENLYQGRRRGTTAAPTTRRGRSFTSCAVRRWTATCATRLGSTWVR